MQVGAAVADSFKRFLYLKRESRKKLTVQVKNTFLEFDEEDVW